MRTPLLAVLGVLCLGWSTSTARAEPYGWAISASSTDPFVQTAPPSGAGELIDLWLWLVCDEVGGVAAAEFDVVATGDLVGPLSLNPAQTSWISAGTPSEVLLVIGGCPTAPLLAGQLVFLDLGAGGTACLAPSAAHGLNVTVDCSYPQPRMFGNSVLGFSSDGSAPCIVGTCTDPTGIGDVEASSWGRVKGIYR